MSARQPDPADSEPNALATSDASETEWVHSDSVKVERDWVRDAAGTLPSLINLSWAFADLPAWIIVAIATICTVVIGLWARERSARGGEVRISGNQLSIRRRWLTERVTLQTPRVCALDPRVSRLRLGTTSGRVLIDVDAATADVLMSAAGAQPNRVREVLLLPDTNWLIVASLVALVFVIWHQGLHHAASVVAVWISLILGVSIVARDNVTIGRDGFAVHRRFRTRFIPWSQVRSIDRRRNGARVELARGVITLVPRQRSRRDRSNTLDKLQAVLERRLWAARSRQVELIAELARNERSFSKWMSALRSQGSYREAAQLDPDALRETLDNSNGVRDVRLGAAIALAESVPETRPRIRVVANATVDPALRNALVRVAEGTFDETALEEFEANGARESAQIQRHSITKSEPES